MAIKCSAINLSYMCFLHGDFHSSSRLPVRYFKTPTINGCITAQDPVADNREQRKNQPVTQSSIKDGSAISGMDRPPPFDCAPDSGPQGALLMSEVVLSSAHPTQHLGHSAAVGQHNQARQSPLEAWEDLQRSGTPASSIGAILSSSPALQTIQAPVGLPNRPSTVPPYSEATLAGAVAWAGQEHGGCANLTDNVSFCIHPCHLHTSICWALAAWALRYNIIYMYGCIYESLSLFVTASMESFEMHAHRPFCLYPSLPYIAVRAAWCAVVL